ncbi:unnamed protein product [Linum trigynum]|uniref:Uncharacterized protein n=1 Tax=Linum trigynum TaxID=586398 RepID=A0AAV2G7B5_9ROSI
MEDSPTRDLIDRARTRPRLHSSSCPVGIVPVRVGSAQFDPVQVAQSRSNRPRFAGAGPAGYWPDWSPSLIHPRVSHPVLARPVGPRVCPPSFLVREAQLFIFRSQPIELDNLLLPAGFSDLLGRRNRQQTQPTKHRRDPLLSAVARFPDRPRPRGLDFPTHRGPWRISDRRPGHAAHCAPLLRRDLLAGSSPRRLVPRRCKGPARAAFRASPLRRDLSAGSSPRRLGHNRRRGPARRASFSRACPLLRDRLILRRQLFVLQDADQHLPHGLCVGSAQILRH